MTAEGSALRRHGDIGSIAGLVAMAALIFRRHLTGQALFLGNFDRLNSFLNVLHAHVVGWQAHSFGAWDDSMFMGRNLFALPFTYPNYLNYFVSLFPADRIYWLAGYVSFGLLCASATAAYVFLRNLCQDQFGAFVGATLYEFSALSTLKVSQNDMSFAVLIHIPIILLLLRGLKPGSVRARFVLLCLVLSHLFILCFLQKVAYAMLLTGLYALFLSIRNRSFLPIVVVSASVTVALIASFPRVYGVARELHELRRMVSPDFDMNNFDALYKWQNFKSFDYLRWFQDGIFGRFYTEKVSLENDLNITEGMLLYTGPLVPFLILGSLIRWRGRWFGLFRAGEGEPLFFMGMLTLAFAVVMSKSVYHIFFRLFLGLDFTHTRIIIAALLPLCALIALMVSRWHRRTSLGSGNNVQTSAIFLLSLLSATIVSFAIEALGDRLGAASRFELTDSLTDFGRQLRLLISAIVHHKPFDAPSPVGHFEAWMKTSVLIQVLLYSVLAAIGAVCAFVARTVVRASSPLGAFLAFASGNLLVVDAWRYADFQVNDIHVQTLHPFAGSNSYMPMSDEFVPPSAAELENLHKRVEREDYRSVLLGSDKSITIYPAPHIGTFWNLRLVEGYSSGVPLRLGVLPWSTDVLGLRTMTFAPVPEAKLPWHLLAFLNVKYGIYVDLPLYKNMFTEKLPPGAEANMKFRVVRNPFDPTPRQFFPREVVTVSTMKKDIDSVFPSGSKEPVFEPTAKTVVESDVPLALGDTVSGDVRAIYKGDRVELTVEPASRPRLLVLDELYHGDWHAYSQGKPLHVYPANVVMRAVVVPAGATSLTFQFEPFCSFTHLSIACGIAIVAAGLFLIIGGRFAPDAWIRHTQGLN